MTRKINIKDRMLNLLQKVAGGKKILINNVKVAPPHRISQDISKWRNAIQQAESYSQQRKKLYDLYEDIMLDGYLRSVTQRRINRATNQKWVFCLPDGTEVEEITQLASRSYFEDLLTYTMQQKFWGHSLMELMWPTPGEEEDGKTLLIPRKNVKPRWQIVTENAFDLQGVQYTKAPFRNNVIEVGGPEDLGLFMSVAQYVIYKRGNFGDWAEFAEIFGIPFRWATYNNEQSRLILEEAMDKAGPAGYVVAPDDAKLDFINGDVTGNGSSVFRFLRQACNEEIGLAVLGNTMTSIESRAGGYAQSETQADAEDDLTTSDIRFCMRQLNEKLVPYLRRLGYPVADGYWKVNDEQEELSLKDRIEVDLKVSEKVPVGNSYWYETYGIPKPEAGDLPEENPEPEPEPEPEAGNAKEEEGEEGPTSLKASFGEEKKNLSRAAQVAQLYDFHHGGCKCDNCLTLNDTLPRVDFRRISRNLEKALRDAVARGDYRLNTELHRQYYSRLRKFARSGFARSLAESNDWADFELQQGMLRNISEFAAAKQHTLIEELRNAYRANPTEYSRLSRAILDRHNRFYLEAELITIEAAANTAGQWQDFIDRADLYPNLQFSTVGDDRVRPGHAALDGAIYPVNDPFWDTHTPPLDWRCRCVLIQTDEETVSTGPPQTVRKGFGGNPYKEKQLIQRSHPYFQLPADELDDLMQEAEQLRAEIERAGVVKQIPEEVGTLQGLTVQLSRDDVRRILDSPSDQKGTRNSLLAALALAIGELSAAGTEAETGYLIYQLQVLDDTYQFFFDQGDTMSLKKVIAI